MPGRANGLIAAIVTNNYYYRDAPSRHMRVLIFNRMLCNRHGDENGDDIKLNHRTLCFSSSTVLDVLAEHDNHDDVNRYVIVLGERALAE